MIENVDDVTTTTISLQRPITNDRAVWSAYWQACDQKWRTEPEIDKERQHFLRGCLKTSADDESDIYPFHCQKLTRADIEWLIANPPVDLDKLLESTNKIIANKQNLKNVSLQTLKKFRRELLHQAANAHILDLRGVDLQSIDLSGLHFYRVQLEDAMLCSANFKGAFLDYAHLERADLSGACLEKASLENAHLERALLDFAHLEKTNLRKAHLEQANLTQAHLEGAILIDASFDSITNLDGVMLSSKQHGSAMLTNVHWDSVDLSGIEWEHLKILGDEQWIDVLKAHYQDDAKSHQDKDKYKKEHQRMCTRQFQQAARAYHRLAIALQEQELEEASYFAYRAHVLQRKVLWQQRKIRSYLFSLALGLFSGYGYKPLRSFLAYAIIIGLFAVLYHMLGSHLAWNEAFVVSMTAFHGRKFFPVTFSPGDLLSFASAIEAFVGLIVEVTFIATLTQRLFGK